MANWSNTEVVLNGDAESIRAAMDYINSFIQNNWLDATKLMQDTSISTQLKFSEAEVLSIDMEETSIKLSLSGRWCSPSGFFKKVAKDFELSGSYLDRECGCDFTHYVEWVNGEEIVNKQDVYFSQLAFDHVDHDVLIEEISSIAEVAGEESWKEEYSDTIALFEANGISLQQIKEKWGISSENTDFEIWWQKEGAEMLPKPGDNMETRVKRIAEIAWSNGAYKASQ